jgi:replicative DNA helicase
MEAHEYKQRLGKRARDIIAYGMGLDKYRPDRNEASCPFHKEKTPSFKWTDKGHFWKCFGCGEVMDIYRYLQEFRHMNFVEAVKEVADLTGGEVKLTVHKQAVQYKKPNIETVELSPEAIMYMETRKISLQTLIDWQVRQRTWGGSECYVFQYFNQDSELEFVSYREIKKGGLKGGCEPKTKQILWGMWHIDTEKPVVITEGQPDAMAIWEAGYKNVVSIPSGSSSLSWIDNCWDWLQKVQEFIIFGDNDEAGMKLIDELVIRLGKYRTKVIEHQHKDANEVLYYQGKKELLDLIEATMKKAPAGIINMSQAEYRGSRGKIDEGIPTGFYALDSAIEDLQPEQISILMGRNGEGKSTVVSQIICNCIDNKIPVFLYSGEMSTGRVLNWLFRQAIGYSRDYYDYVQTKYKSKADVKPDVLEALRKWMSDLFFTYDKSVSNVRKNVDDLFEVMTMAVKRYGCKLLVIDNLMSALEDTADAINADQSNFVQRCKDFAEAYRVHILLVVHPSKVKRRGEILEKEDISGSNNIPNKADYIFSIERQYKEDRDCDAKLRLLKDREEGKYREIKLMFQENTKRLLEYVDGGLRTLNYKWTDYMPKQMEIQGRHWWEEVTDDDLPF